MKILIATDSFKGTFSSAAAGAIMKRAFAERGLYDCAVVPVSDGGDGFGSVASHAEGAQSVKATVKDAFFGTTEAEYHIINGDAYIESARACGMRFGKDVMNATTYGVGQLIASAVSHGAKRIFLGLGGSGTNDGGCGMACALGGVFSDGHSFIPVGRTLENVKSFDVSRISARLKGAEVVGCVDVDNVFFGEDGAARCFAKQKGASYEEILRLDAGMKHLASLLPFDINSLQGSGAAGGLGGGIVAFLGGRLERGFDVVAKMTCLEEKIARADAAITGEGRTDEQTLHGKLPYGVATLCAKHHKPCYIVSGSVRGDLTKLAEAGVSGVFAAYAEPPREIDKTEAEGRLFEASSQAAEHIKGSIYVSSGDI